MVYFIYSFIALVLVSIDQLTKLAIRTNIIEGDSINLLGNFFSITNVKNTGAAFSILQGRQNFFYIITIVALGFFIFLFIKAKESKFERIAITMMIAGALGNFIDRIVNGYVVDFLDFVILGYDFPVFNFADICLTCGGILLIIVIIVEYKRGY